MSSINYYVEVGFLDLYKPNGEIWSDLNVPLNRIAAVVTRSSVSHCCLVIPEFKSGDTRYSQENRNAYEITYAAEKVKCEPAKGFTRIGWNMFSVQVSQSQYKRLKKFCKDVVNGGAGYNYLGFYTFWLPWVLHLDTPNSWFCSQFIVAALQDAGVLDKTNKRGWAIRPAQISPGSLRTIVIRTLGGIGTITHGRMLNQHQRRQHDSIV